MDAQIVHDDGRVELRDPAALLEPPANRYANPELNPTPVAERTWTTYNYAALWMGMAHNIPSYLLASGLIAFGMDWLQAFLTITLANLIVLVPMLLNSHAGTRYGIPFPVFARAFYGVRGANLPALLRAFIACGWFGIQTWIGGQAIHQIMGKLAGDPWLKATAVLGQPYTLWLSFLFFWVVQVILIMRGIDGLRRFENWAAPLVTVAFLALMIWMLVQAGGIGPVLSEPGTLGWGTDFWKVFAPSLMGMIAFWATLSLNMPDFTRFSKGQRQQAYGQILGLPTTMSFISLVSIITTSATIVVYGKAIWDPVALAAMFDNPIVVIIGLIMAILATMSCNVAANVVSPSYDFSNALPRWLNFRTAGLATAIIGILIQPWRLLTDPSIYIFAWLGFYGGVLASIAGVLIAGYWLIGRGSLSLSALYSVGGSYWYKRGWNWRAVAATLLGATFAVGGAYSNVGVDGKKVGPFPVDGLIPWFKPFYDYSWAVGIAAGIIFYLTFTYLAPVRATEVTDVTPATAEEAPA